MGSVTRCQSSTANQNPNHDPNPLSPLRLRIKTRELCSPAPPTSRNASTAALDPRGQHDDIVHTEVSEPKKETPPDEAVRSLR